MNNRVLKLQWIAEALWVIASVILIAFVTWDMYTRVEQFFFYYIIITMFLGVNYLRWIIFPQHSPLMHSFWFKVVIILLNVPIFLLTIKYFMVILEIFDSFDFTQGVVEDNLIEKGASLELIQYIRKLTIASVSTLLISIVIFVFRSLHLIFKWRQLPKYFLK